MRAPDARPLVSLGLALAISACAVAALSSLAAPRPPARSANDLAPAVTIAAGAEAVRR